GVQAASAEGGTEAAAGHETAAEGAASAAAVAGATEAVAAPQDQLGRPGRPVLAFAAIAGMVLMVTPFAVNETSQRLPGTTIDPVDQEGMLGYFMRPGGDASADATTMAEQRPPSGASASGPTAGLEEEPAPDSGYVPEVQPQERPNQAAGDPPDGGSNGSPGDPDSGSSPGNDPGSSAAGDSSGDGLFSGWGLFGGDDEEDEDTSSAGSGRGDEAAGWDADSRSNEPGTQASQGSESDEEDEGTGGDGNSGGLLDSNTNGAVPMAAGGSEDDEDSAPEEESPAQEGNRPVTEDPAGDPLDTRGEALRDQEPQEERPQEPRQPAEEQQPQEPAQDQQPQQPAEEQRPQEERPQEPVQDQQPQEQEQPQPEEPPAEQPQPQEEQPPPPPEFRYAEVAGVGCGPNERIAYGTAGEHWSGDGTDSWAFGFDGGYTDEHCDGRWHAIPVSGDPNVRTNQYAFWTFNIGFTGAKCDIYVHIPNAESPRWVGGAPAQYRIHPSADPATSEPFASFTIDQVGQKGSWVHVGSYSPPGDTISVKLQNNGADQVNGQDTNAHVVSSAVRTRCN
ncbi:hypothetical protein ACFOVU_07790, partial [Nocardiopsis sediminis]